MIANEPYLWWVHSCWVEHSDYSDCSNPEVDNYYSVEEFFINHPPCNVCPGENDWCALYDSQTKFNRSTDDSYFTIPSPESSVTITVTPIEGDFDLYVLWNPPPEECASETNFDCSSTNLGSTEESCTNNAVTSNLIRVFVVNKTPGGFYNISVVGGSPTPYRTEEVGTKEVLVTVVTTTPIVPIPTTTTTTPVWTQVQLGITKAFERFFERLLKR
jgi:hypothetical protein